MTAKMGQRSPWSGCCDCGDRDAGDERQERMEVSEVRILRLEPDGAVLVQLFAEQVQTKSGDGDIVGRKREQQPLRCVSGWI